MFKRESQPGFKKAESLVEVIMAIFIVATGSAVATSLIISALQSNAFSRDNLIALNLAVEGIEAMRAIRDENWLRFSYDKESCWNMRPDVTDCLGSPVAIAAGNYTVDLDVSANLYSWKLPTPPITTALDLSVAGSGNDPYQIAFFDTDLAVNGDGIGTAGDDHDILATASGAANQTGLSRFYRMVNVTYPSTDPEMDVVSTVQWKSQGIKHQVVLTTRLTNYQKVKVK